MSWLATGAGASEGLEQMLARMREEDSLRQHQQQIDESGRANRADEGYRDRALSEQSALREATLANTAEMQRGANADRDEARNNALGDKIATDTPPGTSISPQTSNILKMSGRRDLVQENEPYAFPPSSILPVRGSTVRDVIPGEQEGSVFTGTAGQRQQAETSRASQAESAADNARSASQFATSQENAESRFVRGQQRMDRRATDAKSEGRGQIVQTEEGPKIVDINSGTTRPVTDSGTGQQMKPVLTMDQRNRKAATDRVKPTLDALNELSTVINTKPGLTAKLSGGVERFLAKGNYDDDVAEYMAIVNSFIPQLARAVGHTGVLTQLDVDSVKAILPMPGDSKTLATRKLKRLDTLLQQSSTDDVGGTAGAAGGAGANTPSATPDPYEAYLQRRRGRAP